MSRNAQVKESKQERVEKKRLRPAPVIAFFLFCLLSTAAAGNDGTGRPIWVKDLRFPSTMIAHYQVGVASNAKTLEAGLAQSYNNAISNLLRAEFPERQRVQESSSERLHGSEYNRQYAMDTGDVRLTGVEEATDLGSPFVVSQGKYGQDGHTVYRLLRWKVADIEAERRRLIEERQGLHQPAAIVNARLGHLGGPVGQLEVFTEPPGADITLDGVFIGKSPSQFKLVGAGSYDVTLRLDGHEFKKESIVIGPGQPILLKTKMQRLRGEIKVTSSPSGARVIIDGSPLKQRTPVSVKAIVGEHIIRVEMADFRSESRSIHLDAFSVTMDFPLTYESGILSVSSEPGGATLLVDGIEQTGGLTPRYNLKVDGGERKVKVVKAGYQDYQDKITVLKSKGQSLHVKLVPQQERPLSVQHQEMIGVLQEEIPEPDSFSPQTIVETKSRTLMTRERKNRLGAWGTVLTGIGILGFVEMNQAKADSRASYEKYKNAKTAEEATEARENTEARDDAVKNYGLIGAFGLVAGGVLLIPALTVDVE